MTIIEMPPYLNASYEGDDLYSGNQVRELMKLVAAKEQEAIIDLVAFYGGPVDLEAAIRARGEQA